MPSGADHIGGIANSVRERRCALGLSVRQLAQRAELSPSYVSAIELGKNPSTGRPTAPSKRVLESLGKALGIRLTALGEASNRLPSVGSGNDHTLVYVLGGRRTDILPQLRMLYGNQVEHWVYVNDPRSHLSADGEAESERDTTRITWPFGSAVYPDEFLVPGRIPNALSKELARSRPMLESKDVGFVIGDCSAVMRWVVNPETSVEYETIWPTKICSSFDNVLGCYPAATVCVYNHSDIEAIANRIDILETVLGLINAHGSVISIDSSDKTEVGGRAASAILSQVRPPAVSVNAWSPLFVAVDLFCLYCLTSPRHSKIERKR